MKTNQSLQTLGLSLLALALTVTARSQTYQFSEPITGWLGVSFMDSPSGRSTNYTANFGTLSETVYLNLSADTLRQVGTITLSPSSQSMTIQESGALVTVNTGPVGGSISFDTGPQSLSPISGGYSVNGDIGDISMTGTYSVAVNDGEQFSGSLNYVMHQTVDSAWTFEQVYTDGYPGTISLGGLGNFGGVAYYYEQDTLASISARNGFSTHIISGSYVVPGYGPGDDFYWSSGSVTAYLVPEPASISLLGLGALGLVAWRRR